MLWFVLLVCVLGVCFVFKLFSVVLLSLCCCVLLMSVVFDLGLRCVDVMLNEMI